VAEIFHMAYVMKCPECEADDAWAIELDAGGDKWTEILGFECRCGHYIHIKPITIVRESCDDT